MQFPCIFRYLLQKSQRRGQSRALQEAQTWAPRCSSAKSAPLPKAPCCTSTGRVLHSSIPAFRINQVCVSCNCTCASMFQTVAPTSTRSHQFTNTVFVFYCVLVSDLHLALLWDCWFSRVYWKMFWCLSCLCPQTDRRERIIVNMMSSSSPPSSQQPSRLIPTNRRR